MTQSSKTSDDLGAIDTSTLPEMTDPQLLAKLFDRGQSEGLKMAAEMVEALINTGMCDDMTGPQALRCMATAFARSGARGGGGH